MKKIFKTKLLLLILTLCFNLSCSDDESQISKKSALENFTALSGIESVTLQWDLPSEEVSTYIISYEPGGIYLTQNNGGENELRINNLEAGITYTFTISWLDSRYTASETVTASATPAVRPPGTFPGDLIFENQFELDNFELEGEAALVIVNGNLIIASDGSDNIFDLSVLEDLTLITGDLQILDNPILSNLGGLTSLTNIEGGNITIENNRNLVNFCGLNSVTGVITSDINNNGFNPSFEDILAGNCKTVDLIYEGFPRFNTQAEVDALPDGITHFPGELVVGLDAAINDITDLSKFSKLRRIEGRFIMQRTPLVTDLTGFTSLEFIGNTDADEFVVRQNDGLTSLDGIQALVHVGRRVGIRENPNLTSLEGLNNLNTIGQNTITIGACGNATQGNPLLTDYCALQGIIEKIGIQQLVQSGSCIDSYSSFNPTFQDILDGNCSN